MPKTGGAEMVKIPVNIPTGLLLRLDDIAKRFHASRSELIRQAILELVTTEKKLLVEIQETYEEQLVVQPDPEDPLWINHF